jgi:hypothetical protein
LRTISSRTRPPPPQASHPLGQATRVGSVGPDHTQASELRAQDGQYGAGPGVDPKGETTS